MTGDLVAADETGGVASGDPPFETLFRAHADRLVRLAHLLGAEDPEDIVQEAPMAPISSPTTPDGKGSCSVT